MSLATVVLERLAEIERDVAARGWDVGVGMWTLHADDADDWSDLTTLKIGGEEFYDGHVMELILRLAPPPPCHRAIVVLWEAWHSPSGHPAPREAPDRIDVRYGVAVTRTGSVFVLEHVRDCKPRMVVMDEARLAANPSTEPVCVSLHNLLAQPVEEQSPIEQLLRTLFGGELPPGTIIFGGSA